MTLTRLRQLAKAATPGPWLNDKEFGSVYSQHLQEHEVESVVCHTDANFEQGDTANEANAAFISAANPDTVIHLLDTIDMLKRALEFYGNEARYIPNYRKQIDNGETARAALAKLEEDE